MTGPVVVVLCAVVASLLVAAFLVGSAELDDVLARWEHDRRTRESLRAEEAKRRALAAPRSVPGRRQ